jgi:hypothetical protein
MSAGDFSIGSDVWPGLSKLIEEAGETLQVAGKLIATGGEEDHWDGTNLRARLTEELGDLLAAAQFFIDENLARDVVAQRADDKYLLFGKWHRKQKVKDKLARSVGTKA